MLQQSVCAKPELEGAPKATAVASSMLDALWAEFSPGRLCERTLARMMRKIAYAIVPGGSVCGKTSAGLEWLLATVVCMRTLLVLREVFNRPCLPRRVRKLVCTLLPVWYDGICAVDPLFCSTHR